MCYTVVWRHVIGMVCALNTAHSTHTIPMTCSHTTAQYTHHTYDTLPHHRITYNDLVFTESKLKYNFS